MRIRGDRTVKREARTVGALDGQEHVVHHAELGKQRGDLKRAAQAQTRAAERLKARDVAVEEANAAGAWRDETGDDVEERRLAGAVGADDDEPLAVGRVHVDAAERQEPAEVVTQAFDGERVHHRSR